MKGLGHADFLLRKNTNILELMCDSGPGSNDENRRRVLNEWNPAPKFYTTRYYGVLASRSPHRRYLPDKPTPLIDTEHGADGQDPGLPSAGTSEKKQKSRKRKRVPWAQLLKRAFKIDVLKCDKCGGLMKLIVTMMGLRGNAERIVS